MPEPTTIGTAVGMLKSAGEKIQSLVKLGLNAKVEAAVMDLRNEVRAAQDCAAKAQAEYLALLDEVAKLKKEAVKQEEWAADKERYEFKGYGCETYAYVLKPAMANGQEIHRICADCYNDGRKGLLTLRTKSRGRDIMSRRNCGDVPLGCAGDLPTETVNPGRRRRLYGS